MSSRPWLAVRVSSHDVGSLRVIFISFFLVPTRFTVVAVSTQCPCVQRYPPTSRMCFPFTHLEFVWFHLSPGNPGPLLFPVVDFWSWLVNAATVLVRSAIVLFCSIIISLSSSTAVARLMRESCVPSISFMLFTPRYPPARVDNFYLLLYFRCTDWKCAWKFSQVFLSCCFSPHLSQLS